MDQLQEQVEWVRGFGVEAELMIDPSQVELELALLSKAFDCCFSPISRCYRLRDDGQVVPREYDVYAVLERHDHPFIGSTYFRSMLADDKTLANGRHGLAPPGVLITRALFENRPDAAQRMLASVSFPAIVKPNALGGSIGIDPSAVVQDADAALERLGVVFARLAPVDELRVERYLEGAQEFTVAVLGNGAALATSVTEIIKPKAASPVYSEEDKRTPAARRGPRYGLVADGVLRGSLAALAQDVFRRFGLRDLARFDILLDDRFYVVDINVPPVLSNSFSHEWQVLYGAQKQELLAFALAAYHCRALIETGESPVPMPLLARIPRAILLSLSPLVPIVPDAQEGTPAFISAPSNAARSTPTMRG